MNNDQIIARLFNLGWGKDIGLDSLESYSTSLPPVPNRPNNEVYRLALVDRRIPASKMSDLLDIAYEDEYLEGLHSEPRSEGDVYWIWFGPEMEELGHENITCLTIEEGLCVRAVYDKESNLPIHCLGSTLGIHHPYISSDGMIYLTFIDNDSCDQNDLMQGETVEDFYTEQQEHNKQIVSYAPVRLV